MFTIYRYSFPIDGTFEIEMPKDARIISTQVGRDGPSIWAIVDTDGPLVTRRFRILGTGHPFKDLNMLHQSHVTHIGTIQQDDGVFVWHVFAWDEGF